MTVLLALALLQQPLNPSPVERVYKEHRSLHAVKTSEKITIDGDLSEPAWASAPVSSGFTQPEPKERAPATEDTEVRVLFDHEFLYIGVFAHDSEPDRILITELKKDFNTGQGDYIELVLDSFHDGRNGYMFATNPVGAKWDAQMVNEGREINLSWDGIWFVKSRVTEGGWVAEMAIPFKTLKFPNADVQTWGLNFGRLVRRKNEASFWQELPRIYKLERVSMAGLLEGLEGVKPGANLKIKPYVGGAFTDRNKHRTTTGDSGLDVKYGVTTGLTWDFTYNTDFSQVEADEQQINLTRFSLFFPEKREFFLENSGIFTFGTNEGRGPIGYNPLNPGNPGSAGSGTVGGGRQNAIQNDLLLFFSRSIGLSEDGQAIPLIGGTRLTGRVGRFEIGALNIQQRAQGATPGTNFAVGRFKRNILANSDIGVMMINKEQSGDRYNRIWGADANFRFGKSIYLSGYGARSASPLTKGKGKDGAARLSFGYKDNVWGLRATYLNIQQNFRDEVGYVPRTGFEKLSYYASFDYRPQRFRKWLRTINFHDVADYVTTPGGRLDTRYFDHHIRFMFQSGAGMEIGANTSLEALTGPFRIRSNVTIPKATYTYNEGFISGNTNTSRRVSFNGRVDRSTFYTGFKRGIQIGSVIRPSHRLNTSFNFANNRIRMPQGNFSTNLLTVRGTYSFSTLMFLNALVQYNSDTRQWTSNIRYNIIHRPLSDFFLVYNERRDSRSGDLLDRAVIAKITYMIAR